MSKARLVRVIAWGSAALGVLLSLYAWGSLQGWKFNDLGPYSLFPVLGLVAYSLMISHYLAATVRQISDQPKELLQKYFTITSVAVLVCILLHPSLLIYQLWASGNGLPPASYSSYVASGLLAWIYVGTLSWLAFLLYELRHKFNTRSWWKYVQYASDAAMVGIFFHALMLGQHLAVPWFRLVWYGYGVILIGSLICLNLRYRQK